MTPEQRQELHAVSHLSARFAGRMWRSAGCEIWSGRVFITSVRTEELASYLCRLHNIYLPVANEAIVLLVEVDDLRRTLRVPEHDRNG